MCRADRVQWCRRSFHGHRIVETSVLGSMLFGTTFLAATTYLHELVVSLTAIRKVMYDKAEAGPGMMITPQRKVWWGLRIDPLAIEAIYIALMFHLVNNA